MILSFADSATEDIFNGSNSKRARGALPDRLHKAARRKLDFLNAAADITDLKTPPGNALHALKDDRAGQHAIKVNKQYRICFVWTDAGPESVEITDYH